MSARFRLGKSSVGTSGPWTWGGYGEAIDADALDYIKVELESSAGVATINVTIPRADEITLEAGVPAVTITQASRTATFRVGADAATYCVEVTANPSSTSAEVAALAVHVPLAGGGRLIALDETTEADATYKWVGKVNAAIRSADATGAAVGIEETYHKVRTGVVTTTDDTPTDLLTYSFAEAQCAIAIVHCCANDASGNTGAQAYFIKKFSVLRELGGTIAISDEVDIVPPTAGTWDVTLDADEAGDNVDLLRVQVTGHATDATTFSARLQLDIAPATSV